MTLIDQRILIPAPMPAVWKVIADHSQLTKWRTDVQSVSILTTEHHRPGARRRITAKVGRADIIEEISIWYDGVGYEYFLVQGGDYREFSSRMRLQGTTDGTIVQWTMSYHLGGILKRILRGRARRKRLETQTADSLRKLRQYIERSGIKLDQEYRDKNRIKQAPDASFRAEYGAKLIAQEQVRSTQPKRPTDSGIKIPEPPVRIDDTPSVPLSSPPSFLVEALQDTSEMRIPEPTPTVSDTRPRDIVPDVPVAKQPISDDDAVAAITVAETSTAPSDTRPHPPVEESAAPEPSGVSPNTTADNAEGAPTLIPTAPPTANDEDVPPPTSMRDTGEMSIWDVFGVQRPSEEISTKLLAPEDNTATEEETPEISTALSDDTIDKADDVKSEPITPINATPLPPATSTPIEDPTEPKPSLVNALIPPSMEEKPPEPAVTAANTVMDEDATQPKPSIESAETSEPVESEPVEVVETTGGGGSEPDDPLPVSEEPAVPPASKRETAEHQAVEADDQQPIEQPAKQEKTSLDEWLAADEPPIPESSTGTMKTVVRIERRPKIGLRRLQRQRQMKVRRPKNKD